MKITPHISWAIRRDMAEIQEIENLQFEFPWSEDDFIRALRQRNCIGLVAKHDEKIVGYAVYELHPTKLHVLNFAVHPSCQRQGVGHTLAAKLKTKLADDRRIRIMLEVRESNLDALLFWKAMGFRALRIERNFYEDTPESAIVMQYRLPVHAEAIA